MASVGVAPAASRLREGTTHTTGVEGLPQEMNDMIIRDDKVLGTPTREEIKCMNPNYTEYKFPQIKAHPWHKIFQKRMPPEAVDLVSRLLQYHFPAMALRRLVGFSDGELMRSDCKPCSTLMNQTARISTVGGGLGFWILCRLHYGPRVTVPRSLRWAACGAVSISSSTALLVRLFSPECEPQNIDAYDKGTQQY